MAGFGGFVWRMDMVRILYSAWTTGASAALRDRRSWRPRLLVPRGEAGESINLRSIQDGDGREQ
jgi:hypothetical protein